jgi:hypothetical protein
MRSPYRKDPRQDHYYPFIGRDHPVRAKFQDLAGKCGFEAGAELASRYRLHVKPWVGCGICKQYSFRQNIPDRHLGMGSRERQKNSSREPHLI